MACLEMLSQSSICCCFDTNKWVVSSMILESEDLCHRAGDLVMLRWLYENGARWDSRTCANIARLGDLGMLKWARCHGCPWHQGCTTRAAENNHLAVLKWARENGCPWSAKALYLAAQNGHKEVVQWLFDNDAPRDNRTAIYAAAHSLEMLQFCVDYGRVPLAGSEEIFWSPTKCTWPCASAAAADRGCQATLDWLEAQGQTDDAVAIPLFASCSGHFELAKRYIERGYSCPDLDVVLISKYPSIHFLEWLRERNAPIDEVDFFSFALRQHQLESIRWAYEHQLFTKSLFKDFNSWETLIDDDLDLSEMIKVIQHDLLRWKISLKIPSS